LGVNISTNEERALTSVPDRPHGSLRSRILRNQWLVGDQALVSAMNFLTSAVLARMLGVHEFGVFSVFYIILQYLNSIQLALIVSPMMTLAPLITEKSERATFLKGLGGYQYLFSGACCAFTLLMAAVEKLRLGPARIDPSVLLPFAFSIFCFQAQDWLRRFWYVDERGRTVFINDVISYVGQVVVLLVLWRIRAASVRSAYYAVALTSLAAFLVGAGSEDVWPNLRQIRAVIKKTWAFGRSLLVASQFQWVGSQGILIIVAAISGVNAAGGIRAVMALLGPVNVLYQLLDNVIPVRAAREFSKSGRAGLLAYLRRIGILLSLFVGVPVLVISLAAKPIMAIAFGRDFETFAHLVFWQAIYVLLALLYKGLQYYHRTMGTVRVLARTALIVSVVSVGSCVVLARQFGATGGMIALVAGQTLNVAIPLGALVYSKPKAAAA
jgi:O-antigen/teichoic acid export membrane protein